MIKLNIQKTKIMIFGPITSWQIDGETAQTVAAAMKLKTLAPWKKSYDKPRQHNHFADKDVRSQIYGFPVVIYRCERRAI